MLQYQSAGAFGSDLQGRRSTWARRARRFSLTLAWIAIALAALAVLTPIGGIVAIVVAGCVMRNIRQRRAMTVLSYIEQAVRLNMPLGRVLWAAQDSESGLTRRRLCGLRQSLEAGAPLGTALEVDVPEMPKRVVRLVRAGEGLGRLPAVLCGLVARQHKGERDNPADGRSFTLAYPIIVSAVMCWVVTLLVVYIVPKFEQLLKDSHVPMPWITRQMIWLANDFGLAIVAAVGVAFALYAGLHVGAIFRTREPRGAYLLDWLAWRVPLLGSAARDQGMADVCQLLAEGLRVGHTLHRAMLEAEELHINEVLRRRVTEWQAWLRVGIDCAEAAKRAAMPPLVVGMVGTAQASGNLAETFEFLARYYAGRFSRTALLLKNAVLPAMTVFFGILVCAVALAMFLPMMRLVDVNMNWVKL